MYKKSQDKSNEILRLYNQGVVLTEICRLTSSSQPTVKKVLLHFGINYDSNKEAYYKKKLEKAIQFYKEGKSQLFIEKELKLTRKTIRDVLKLAIEVDYRDRSEQHHIRYKTEIDHNVFDELTSESLYWIGMLYTDGHIEQKREASIDLTLHNNDEPHLEKFKSFLKSNRKITPGDSKGSCKRVRVNSKKIRDRLVSLGFTANKSVTIFPHEDLKESKDFWRGCIDGDGGIYKRSVKNPTLHITLCGTLATIFEFINFCVKEVKVKNKYPTKCLGKNLYTVSYYGNDARKVAGVLYKDATIYLERKYQTYITEFIEPLKQVI